MCGVGGGEAGKGCVRVCACVCVCVCVCVTVPCARMRVWYDPAKTRLFHLLKILPLPRSKNYSESGCNQQPKLTDNKILPALVLVSYKAPTLCTKPDLLVKERQHCHLSVQSET